MQRLLRDTREFLVWPGARTEGRRGRPTSDPRILAGLHDAAYYDFDGLLIGVIPPHKAWVCEAYDALEDVALVRR